MHKLISFFLLKLYINCRFYSKLSCIEPHYKLKTNFNGRFLKKIYDFIWISLYKVWCRVLIWYFIRFLEFLLPVNLNESDCQKIILPTCMTHTSLNLFYIINGIILHICVITLYYISLTRNNIWLYKTIYRSSKYHDDENQ